MKKHFVVHFLAILNIFERILNDPSSIMEEGIAIGKKLRTIRHAHSYTREFVADALGVPPAKVGRWERDEAFPDIEELRKAASFYNVSLEWMLSPEPIVQDIHHNQEVNGAGTNNAVHMVPKEFLDRITAQYDAHIQALHHLTDRMLDLLGSAQNKMKR